MTFTSRLNIQLSLLDLHSSMTALRFLRHKLVTFIALFTSSITFLTNAIFTKCGNQVPSSLTVGPTLPWKTQIQITLLSAITDAAFRKDGTINRRLINFFDFQARPNSKPVDGVRSADFSVDPSKPVWVRVFSPADSFALQTLPVIVFFHGGGFVFLTAASKAYDAVCRRFSRELNAVVVSVTYRLAPEHRFPAAYEDGIDALRWLNADPTCAGFAPSADPERVFLAGDSAGANIAHHVAVRSVSGVVRSLRVIGMISIQPFFGGEERTKAELRLKRAPLVSIERTDFMWKAFLPHGSDRDHPAANVWGTDQSEVAYPSTMVVVGGMDPLQDLQRRYVGWLKEMGKEVRLVEYESGIHSFYAYPELPETAQLMTELKSFINRR